MKECPEWNLEYYVHSLAEWSPRIRITHVEALVTVSKVCLWVAAANMIFQCNSGYRSFVIVFIFLKNSDSIISQGGQSAGTVEYTDFFSAEV